MPGVKKEDIKRGDIVKHFTTMQYYIALEDVCFRNKIVPKRMQVKHWDKHFKSPEGKKTSLLVSNVYKVKIYGNYSSTL